MMLSKVIERLTEIFEKEGDMQTTCTGVIIPESGPEMAIPDVFETTLENFIIKTEPSPRDTFANVKRLRFYL